MRREIAGQAPHKRVRRPAGTTAAHLKNIKKDNRFRNCVATPSASRAATVPSTAGEGRALARRRASARPMSAAEPIAAFTVAAIIDKLAQIASTT
jgi:hypothetical protein